MDHVSDTFLETNVPLLVLIEAAKAGDERGVEEYAQVFTEHANKLVEVSATLYGLYGSVCTGMWFCLYRFAVQGWRRWSEACAWLFAHLFDYFRYVSCPDVTVMVD